MTLIEVMVFITIVSVAMLAAMFSYARSNSSKVISEQRRQAMMAAEQKMDEIREFIRQRQAQKSTNPLDDAYTQYGYNTSANGGLPGNLPGNNSYATSLTNQSYSCVFSVPNLEAIDTGSGPQPVGTVTIVNSAAPDETLYGWIYDGSSNPKVFCVNLYGNIYPDNGYPSTSSKNGFPKVGVPAKGPFPLIIKQGGTLTNNNVKTGFALLPVVVTIRWMTPYGTVERVDLFAMLGPEKVP
jgi:type II secretory pathway pseudopilin PulG